MPGATPNSTRPAPELWFEAGIEPALDDLFADPLLHLVLKRDGISLGELKQVIAAAQAKLRRQLCLCLAA